MFDISRSRLVREALIVLCFLLVWDPSIYGSFANTPAEAYHPNSLLMLPLHRVPLISASDRSF